MEHLIDTLANSPLLALVGLLVVIAILIAPIMLRLAGLTGGQVLELFRATMSFILSAIHEFRASNEKPPSP